MGGLIQKAYPRVGNHAISVSTGNEEKRIRGHMSDVPLKMCSNFYVIGKR